MCTVKNVPVTVIRSVTRWKCFCINFTAFFCILQIYEWQLTTLQLLQFLNSSPSTNIPVSVLTPLIYHNTCCNSLRWSWVTKGSCIFFYTMNVKFYFLAFHCSIILVSLKRRELIIARCSQCIKSFSLREVFSENIKNFYDVKPVSYTLTSWLHFIVGFLPVQLRTIFALELSFFGFGSSTIF
jgi:hypothetical protein